MSERTVIVGGGLAAQRFLETFLREGGEGPITLISGETEHPYDRPPLSKEALKGGEVATEFKPVSWYGENGVDLVLGDPATALNTDERVVTLSSGREIPYDRLLIATGSEPRMIPGFDRFENTHTFRNADDARRLAAALNPGTRIAIVGAGFIGLEVASTALSLGAKVTVVEAEPIPLRGLLGEELGTWLVGWHVDEGIDVVTGTGVESVEGDKVAQAIVLTDGRRIELDELLVAVGAKPSTDWLEGSGLELDNGVRCRPDGQTDADGVWVAGDIANLWREAEGNHRRAEHWEAAVAQGRAAARSMLGLEHRPGPITSFWSDMHGVRIQHFGHPQGADRVEIDGETDSLDFEAIWYAGEQPVAALAVGRPRSVPALRKLFSKPSVSATN